MTTPPALTPNAFPTWQCPNCDVVDEFSVQHCSPDEVGAIYPVVECHICGLIASGEAGEKAREAAVKNPSPPPVEAEPQCGAHILAGRTCKLLRGHGGNCRVNSEQVEQPPVEAKCECGHSKSWHFPNGWLCSDRFCKCQRFTPIDEAATPPAREIVEAEAPAYSCHEPTCPGTHTSKWVVCITPASLSIPPTPASAEGREIVEELLIAQSRCERGADGMAIQRAIAYITAREEITPQLREAMRAGALLLTNYANVLPPEHPWRAHASALEAAAGGKS